jgi:hypothetical protein
METLSIEDVPLSEAVLSEERPSRWVRTRVRSR